MLSLGGKFVVVIVVVVDARARLFRRLSLSLGVDFRVVRLVASALLVCCLRGPGLAWLGLAGLLVGCLCLAPKEETSRIMSGNASESRPVSSSTLGPSIKRVFLALTVFASTCQM